MSLSRELQSNADLIFQELKSKLNNNAEYNALVAGLVRDQRFKELLTDVNVCYYGACHLIREFRNPELFTHENIINILSIADLTKKAGFEADKLDFSDSKKYNNQDELNICFATQLAKIKPMVSTEAFNRVDSALRGRSQPPKPQVRQPVRREQTQLNRSSQPNTSTRMPTYAPKPQQGVRWEQPPHDSTKKMNHVFRDRNAVQNLSRNVSTPKGTERKSIPQASRFQSYKLSQSELNNIIEKIETSNFTSPYGTMKLIVPNRSYYDEQENVLLFPAHDGFVYKYKIDETSKKLLSKNKIEIQRVGEQHTNIHNRPWNPSSIHCMTLNNEKVYISSADEYVYIWNNLKHPIHIPNSKIKSIVGLDNGWIACSDRIGRLYLIDTKNHNKVYEYDNGEKFSDKERLNQLTIVRGKLIQSSDSKEEKKIFDINMLTNKQNLQSRPKFLPELEIQKQEGYTPAPIVKPIIRNEREYVRIGDTDVHIQNSRAITFKLKLNDRWTACSDRVGRLYLIDSADNNKVIEIDNGNKFTGYTQRLNKLKIVNGKLIQYNNDTKNRPGQQKVYDIGKLTSNKEQWRKPGLMTETTIRDIEKIAELNKQKTGQYFPEHYDNSRRNRR